jgi:hypothetical protein
VGEANTSTPAARSSAVVRGAGPGSPGRSAASVQRAAAPPPVRAKAEKRAGRPVVDQQRGDGELDELARRLVEPLARLLRAELRMDRERVGRLRDRRR